jgi:hypothetical protein
VQTAELRGGAHLAVCLLLLSTAELRGGTHLAVCLLLLRTERFAFDEIIEFSV